MATLNVAIRPINTEIPGTVTVDSQSRSGGCHQRHSIHVVFRYSWFGRSAAHYIVHLHSYPHLSFGEEQHGVDECHDLHCTLDVCVSWLSMVINMVHNLQSQYWLMGCHCECQMLGIIAYVPEYRYPVTSLTSSVAPTSAIKVSAKHCEWTPDSWRVMSMVQWICQVDTLFNSSKALPQVGTEESLALCSSLMENSTRCPDRGPLHCVAIIITTLSCPQVFAIAQVTHSKA